VLRLLVVELRIHELLGNRHIPGVVQFVLVAVLSVFVVSGQLTPSLDLLDLGEGHFDHTLPNVGGQTAIESLPRGG